jgi:hypothetical protein
VYTVTGCEWSDWNPWGGPPGGWFGPNNGWNGWGDWGHGWTWTTRTTTVLVTATNSAGHMVTTSGLETLALAASGSVTNSHTLAAADVQGATAVTTTPSPSGNAAASDGAEFLGVKVMGALLAAVVAIAGLL